jgi:hypothetical protein
MSETFIYIDDTGTPGQVSKSKYDTGDWKTWIGVILTRREKEKLSFKISKYLAKLNSEFGITEFHFTDIYSGTNEFKNVPIDKRIEIFEYFAKIYSKGNYPFYIQSLTSDDVIRNKFNFPPNLKRDNFDFSNISDLSLFFLLFNIKDYILKNFNNYDRPIDILIDEGKQKANSKQKIWFLKNISINSSITYRSSKEEVLIQFADFIAYSMNKMRWLAMNNKKGESDKKLFEIFNLARFNPVNLEMKVVDLYEFKVEDYDKALRDKYDENKNLSDEEVKKAKEK